MRPQTKNEKLLLSILVAIVFAGGNYFGYHWLAQKQSSLQLAAAQLQADQAEAKVDLLESSTWAQRTAWIHDHEPSLGDEGETKAAVFNYVKKGATDNKLEVVDEQIVNDVERGAGGTRVNVSVTVQGSLPDLCKWLAPLQTPDQFYAVSSFSLSAPDMKSYICKLRIARYFREGS